MNEAPGQDTKTVPALTKADLFAAGLTGRPDSAARRLELLKQLELPEHMSANALLNVLNGLLQPRGGKRAAGAFVKV